MRKATKVHKGVLPKGFTRANFLVPTDLYQAFGQICASQDLTFSQMLRKYLRETVDAHETVEKGEAA